MFNKKTDPELQKFWEHKLNIKYDIEFEQYKKLCGLPYKKKLTLKKYLDTQDRMIYDIWHKNVVDDINKLTYYEMLEYSRYLNQKIRENQDRFALSQTILAPCMIFFLGFMLNMLSDFIGELFGKVISFVGLTVCSAGLLLYVLKELLYAKEEVAQMHFYQDMKEIVDKYITDMNKREKYARQEIFS